MKQFFTRQAANTGQKLMLSTPSGDLTKFFISILGVDADIVRKVKADNNRRYLQAEGKAKMSEDEIQAIGDEGRIRVLCSLISDWNLEDEEGNPIPCSDGNKRILLTEAPNIADQINVAACDRASFLPPSSSPSTPGAGESADSSTSQAEQSSAVEQP